MSNNMSEVASSEQENSVLSPPSGFKLRYTLEGHSDIITQIAWSADGKKLASASKDHTIQLWNTETGELMSVLEGHTDTIFGIAWSPDGEILASVSADETIKIWNTKTGNLRSAIENENSNAIAWNPSGKIFASRNSQYHKNKEINFWDARIEKKIDEKFENFCRKIEINYRRIANLFSQNRVVVSDKDIYNNHIFGGDAFSIDNRGASFVIGTQNVTFNLYSENFYYKRQSFGDLLDELLRQKSLSKLVWDSSGQVLALLNQNLTSIRLYKINAAKQKHLEQIEKLQQLEREWNEIFSNVIMTTQTKRSIEAEMVELRELHAELAERNELELVASYITQTSFESINLENSKFLAIAWSPDSKVLASAILNGTVMLWDTATGSLIRVLEGHADAVTDVSFSFDGKFLVSKSLDNSVRLWNCKTWETVAVIHESTSGKWLSSVAFNPKLPILATLGEKDTIIHIWELDFPTLLTIPSVSSSVHYVNAKVVLVGDSGVGKSGLGLVLSGEYFRPTESTHGRRVWTFDQQGIVEDSQAETRETMLWDLAGQPGYRLIHQLHLNEVAVALIVFDTRSETDPFAGVRHWDRALTQAQRLQSSSTSSLKKFLVAARADRGGIGISPKRIDTWVKELDFDGYFETSAKEGWKIPELVDTIRNAINWKALPSVSSTRLFQQIKDFLIAEKKAERLLSTVDDLYRAFLKSENAPTETEKLRSQFDICIGRVESRDLIRRISFGNYVLLQPELLDAYASALINAAKDEPDGLGSIAEEDARHGRFRMSEDERIKDKTLEELLLIATVEELLYHELALREWADDGAYLVFPSQFTREWPDAPNPEGQTVIFEFEGAVLNIYATLAVRLTRSGFFIKQDLWKNAATYKAKVGGLCGIFLREVQEGKGQLTIFFDRSANEQTRSQFEDYILIHLKRRALAESIKQRRIFACHNCGATIPEQHIQMRRERGFDWIACSVCESRISLIDPGQAEQVTEIQAYTLAEMDKTANLQRNRDTATSSLQGKIATKDFDVFLCHNSDDKPNVKGIGQKLKEFGILPWLDEWELRPGLPWQRALEEQIRNIKAAAVFIGKNNTGPWQDAELDAFLREFVRRRCPVIPVLLPDCVQTPKLPIFLESMMWVDFRQSEPDPMKQLIWGITDERKS
ncbi:TIR domain-containing protein [Tolypothrix sp. FACHB-123]|uniref:TIR domain-containing protein n=1 Tax=Tolypothrix sp. FACHB-123 TaxID=2692868 RepID=UPI0016878EA5|nr:TIR domain-containing protein [Tolypothrix sp. FACHB-123]MBD2358865.1 TIR domain-containing protein [Tolypothrix sp. FACHB-123]